MSDHRGLAGWHAYMADGGDPQALRDLLAEDAVFHSPVVHTPQEGRDKVFAYLHAASHVLGGDDFRYLRAIVDGDQAMLEFATMLDDIQINGVLKGRDDVCVRSWQLDGLGETVDQRIG